MNRSLPSLALTLSCFILYGIHHDAQAQNERVIVTESHQTNRTNNEEIAETINPVIIENYIDESQLQEEKKENATDQAQNTAYLGVTYEVTDQKEIRVKKVIEKSAAFLMGLEAGDLILQINNEPVDPDFYTQICKFPAGEWVELEIKRGRKTKYVKGILGRRAKQHFIIRRVLDTEQKELKYISMRLGAKIKEENKNVIIEQVFENGTAEKLGLQVGDQITGINDQEVQGTIDCMNIIRNQDKSKDIKLTFIRKNEVKTSTSSWQKMPPSFKYRNFENPRPVTWREHTHLNEIKELKQNSSRRSSERKIDIEKDIALYPNPSHGELKLQYHLEKDDLATIEIRDLNGKIVHSEELQGEGGLSEYPISIEDQVSGTYILIIKDQEEVFIRKIVLKKS